jgi:hypothetical protein
MDQLTTLQHLEYWKQALKCPKFWRKPVRNGSSRFSNYLGPGC